MASSGDDIPWFKITVYGIGTIAGIYAIYWLIEKFWPLLLAGGLGAAAAKFAPGMFGGSGGGSGTEETEEETPVEEQTPAESEMDAAQQPPAAEEEAAGSGAAEESAAAAGEEAAGGIETGLAAEAEEILAGLAFL